MQLNEMQSPQEGTLVLSSPYLSTLFSSATLRSLVQPRLAEAVYGAASVTWRAFPTSVRPGLSCFVALCSVMSLDVALTFAVVVACCWLRVSLAVYRSQAAMSVVQSLSKSHRPAGSGVCATETEGYTHLVIPDESRRTLKVRAEESKVSERAKWLKDK